MANPENIRAAAYLAARERLDFRRTQRVKCKPPNRQCGNRCIPPGWDCRLKGEGEDGHLRAVGKGSDPVSGLANIERGLGRLRKGFVKLSFSELEGGRRAIARGTAKLTPGDIQKKKELQEKVNNVLGAVLIPGAAVVGGLLFHQGMKSFPAYRTGPGAQIDETLSNVFRTVARNTPVYGEGVRAREAIGPLAVQTMQGSMRTVQAGSPDLLTQHASSRRTITRLTQTSDVTRGLGTDIVRSLRSVDNLPGSKARSNLAYPEWEQKSLTAFITTPRSARISPVNDLGEGSAFSVVATNDLLGRSFAISSEGQSDMVSYGKRVVRGLSDHLRRTGSAIRTTMREYGQNPNDADSVRRFIASQNFKKPLNTDIADRYTSLLERATLDNDHYRQASNYYRDTVRGFDDFFRNIADNIQTPPSISLSRDLGPELYKQARRESFYNDAVQSHAQYLANNINLPSGVYGPGTATLVKKIYHGRWVSARPKFNSKVNISLTATEVTTAASEIAIAQGVQPPADQTSALRLLEETYGSLGGTRNNGVGSITVARGTPRGRRSSPETTGQERPARRRRLTKEERVARYIRAGYSPEAAAAKAERDIEQLKRRDRADAYLQARVDYTAPTDREGKPCGKSFIGKNEKCSKPTSRRYADKPQLMMGAGGRAVQPQAQPSTVAAVKGARSQRNKNQSLKEKAKEIATGAAIVGVGAAATLLGAKHAKVAAYRKNVAKSAVEAEKLSIEFERQFRDQAARRLKKRAEDVTGFEASVYNFKDKGRDSGFGSMDNDPAWYGQTKNSKGAVVMLSYADDNKFTTRGQGSYMMAKGGAFQQIWGDRDILPYANNISQPTDRAIDDLQVQKRERIVKKAEEVAGPVGKGAAKAGLTVKDTFQRFGFLRKNVNERGFNPDAVRAAAFVVAQRRLTGKSVDIMSYSNGGNVATETLAILKEMGYRDVKVVNIAGPTFGIFEHSRDNMRTWVSEGDDFYKISRGMAFQGGNTRMLKNKNIPHGLTEKIDVNNREFGKEAKANYKAKNSYLLDEQLQREAYKYLTVDRKRSTELLDETIWRISENKPMEGDLAVLYGDESAAKLTEYRDRINNAGRNRDQVKSDIQDEIEDRMLEKWYGGYNPKAVKKAQDGIRKELQTQVNPQPRKAPRRPMSINQRATKLMQQNPGMSRAAALKQARRESLDRKTDALDSYLEAFTQTKQRYQLRCAA